MTRTEPKSERRIMYLTALDKHPVITKALTSAFLTFIGDLICQGPEPSFTTVINDPFQAFGPEYLVPLVQISNCMRTSALSLVASSLQASVASLPSGQHPCHPRDQAYDHRRLIVPMLGDELLRIC
ncbi:hypothetical protein KSP40_PGU010747 [Platanthera guangdongensis]|uniref:Uncharacterized protein n=1 Tax=Platanthera guangdongensis TaxID=2320717 RepID=A0ABR2LJY8_9ASPA